MGIRHLNPDQQGAYSVNKTILVPSKAVLVEAPPVRVLLLAINARIRPFVFMNVPKAQLGPGSEEC